MSRLILSLTLALLLTSSLDAQIRRVDEKMQTTETARIRRATNELAHAIHDAKLLLVAVKDREVRRKLESLLNNAQGNTAVIQASLFRDGANGTIMSKAEFEQLKRDVKGQSFSERKSRHLVQFARLANGRSRLNSKQAKILLEMIEFDKDKIEAAVELFGVVADRENYQTALGAFDFESNKKKVLKRLKLD